MKNRYLLAVAALPLLGACAIESSLPREAVADREYVTGSSLPRRASTPGVAVYSADEAERMRDQQILPMDSPNRQRGP